MIGLGNLGNPMAVNLLAEGYRLVVNSLVKSEATNLLDAGATWADSAAELATQVDVLITVLPRPEHVREVLIGSGDALAHLHDGATIIDMSTSSADIAREVQALAAPRDIAVIDAPVSFLAKTPIGSSRSVASLQLLVGATPEQFAHHFPLFKALGGIPDQIMHVGPAGAGYSVKVLLNMLWFIYAAGTSEVLALSSKLGVDLRVLQKALCASPSQSNFLQYDINSVLERGDYDEGFTIELVVKDLQLALGLGEATGIDTVMGRVTEQMHRKALERYGPTSGEMSVVKLYEEAAGVQFRD